MGNAQPGMIGIADEEMSEAPVEKEVPQRIRMEIDKLLKMAEELQAKCEELDRNWFFNGIQGVTLIVLALTASIYFIFTYSLGSNYPILVPSIAVSYLSIVVTFCYLSQSRLSRSYSRDRSALLSIVDLLREVLPALTDSAKLSVLERAEIRIRLGRFNIGTGKSNTTFIDPYNLKQEAWARQSESIK